MATDAAAVTSRFRRGPLGARKIATAVLFALVLCAISASASPATTNSRQPARPVAVQSVPRQTTAKDTVRRMEHPAFNNVGVEKGLLIWRIENFEPVPVAKAEYGKFYIGDSYIVLNTKEDSKKRFSHDIHYWLGTETSQDESGSVAYLAVTLDNQLGGGPVEHREVQGHESPLFLGYFKPSIRYLNGGHASGFTHVTTNAGAEKKMYQVKGKKNIRVRQVEPNISSMNAGDCFILDIGHEIYVYVGPRAKRVEKLKAISAANQIKDQDHAGRARVEIIDEFSSEVDFGKFFTALGSGSRNAVPAESSGGDDQAFERSEEEAVSLYRITDESGKLQAIKVAQKPFTQDQLNENDCFVLDTVTGGIYVWVGKRCNDKERAEVMSKAQEYMRSKNYPSWVHVTRVPQGTEPAGFKQYFSTWRDHGALHTRLIRSASDEEMYSSDQEVANARIEKVAKSGSARGFMPDNGDGHTIVYRIEHLEMVKVADSEDPEKSDQNGAKFGQFYQGDSYVIKYKVKGGSGYIIYFWLGKDSTMDEKAAAAMQTVAIDNELNGAGIQVRVPQSEEPKHFLKIFKGQLITHLGGHASSFKNLNEKDTYDTDGTRLFRVHGNDTGDDMRAEQVPEERSFMASDDIMLLETPEKVYAWIGKGASQSEIDGYETFAKTLFGEDKVLEKVNEGKEPKGFFDQLGDDTSYVPYSTIARTKRLRLAREPHLLQAHINYAGKIKLQDIGGFTQLDLDEDDVFLLDAGEEIYAWIGKHSTRQERDSIQSAVEEHLRTDPSDRTPASTVLVTVKQGKEPEVFKKMFETWDDDMWTNQPSYDDIKSRMIQLNEVL